MDKMVVFRSASDGTSKWINVITLDYKILMLLARFWTLHFDIQMVQQQIYAIYIVEWIRTWRTILSGVPLYIFDN